MSEVATVRRRAPAATSNAGQRRRWRTAALSAAVALLATACASDAPLDTLEPKGSAARTIQDLVAPVFAVAGVVFVLVMGAIVLLVIRFRAGRSDDPDELPPQTHGHLGVEIAWTVVPAALLAAIGLATIVTIFDLAAEPADALQVTVTGQQWWWSYEYDIDGDGEVDFITANEMVIPADTEVVLAIESRDVIHSFWIPPLNGKRDAVPGRSASLVMQADEPGTYRGQCTEFCGLSHGFMRMRVQALTQDDFDEWADGQQQDSVEATTDEQIAGRELFTQLCATCHLIGGVNNDTYDGADQVSGTAPNLTHLMSRTTFAGSTLDLYLDVDDRSYEEIIADGVVNRAELEAWIRDPSALKPMAPDPSRGNEFGRGMPDLGLTEDQIDDLVAYLMVLE